MKDGDYRRSVKPQRHDRAPGDAPSLGRVARMPRGHETGERKRRRSSRSGSGQKGGSKSMVVLVWSGVLAAASLVILIVFLVAGMKKRGSGGSQDAAGEPVREERVVSQFQSPPEAEALEMVSKATLTEDVKKIEELFRLGETKGGDVVEFLKNWRRSEGKVTRTQWMGSVDANGLLLDGVVVVTGEFPEEKNRVAFLTPDEEGVWKLDFDAFARTVKPAWDEIMKPTSDGGMVRVIVAKDDYFNGPFLESDGWVSYGMASPDLSTNLYGYCRKDSLQDEALAKILSEKNSSEGGKQIRRATLELKRVGDAGVRQFEIKRVLAEDWVVSDLAFDGTVK